MTRKCARTCLALALALILAPFSAARIGAGAEGYYSNFRDVIKFYLPINTHFEQWYLVMNLDLWKGMAKADQDNRAASAQTRPIRI